MFLFASRLYGVDFRYTVSRYTGVDGIVSFQYKTGGQIVLRAPCIKKQIEVPFSAQYRPSTCPAGGDEGILTPRKGVAVDTALVTFIFTGKFVLPFIAIRISGWTTLCLEVVFYITENQTGRILTTNKNHNLTNRLLR